MPALRRILSEYWAVMGAMLITLLGIQQVFHPVFLLMEAQTFLTFQAVYTGVVVFVILFTSLQYLYNKEASYLYYSIYLIANLIYFVRIFPNLIAFFIPEGWMENYVAFIQQYGRDLELLFSMILIASYMRFSQVFLDLPNQHPRVNSWFKNGYKAAVLYVLIDFIIILIWEKSFAFELLCKFSLVPIGLYAFYLLYRSGFPLFEFIILGSYSLMIGATVTVVILILGQDGYYAGAFVLENNNHFSYMLSSGLLEILLFSTAIGYKSILQEQEKTITQKALFEQQNENNRLRIHQLEADIKTLKSQINPHFIFNSLNAIKMLIQQGDNDKATKYLIKFSAFLRLIMEQVTATKITLEEELQFSEVYLQLEALRFDGSFEYQIEIPEDLDTSFYDVPSLILQPFLENAIWHGLLHKEGQREVNIHVHMRDEDLICSIEDNGIGRARSAQLNAHNNTFRKTSVGIKNTTERIRLFEQLYRIGIQVNIEDLVDPEGAALGTRVVIVIES